MKKKMGWLLVSGLMVSSLVLASCAPATPTTPTTPTAPTAPTTLTAPTTPTTQVTTPEAPKYGGVLVLPMGGATGSSAPIKGWDEKSTPTHQCIGTMLVCEGLATGDWAKGPAGTGETSFLYTTSNMDYERGAIAESWEFIDPNTLVFHIRKGIRYALDPSSEASRLVNGREVVAEDVAFEAQRILADPKTFTGGTFPGWFQSVEIPDKYSVILHGKDTELCRTARVVEQWIDNMYVVPPELVKKYGDLSNWKNVVGTGPFTVIDYVSGSSATFKRNPNYWMTDPVGPGKGNQLPYLDGVKLLEIPDESTRLAAFRTGKIDFLDQINVDDWQLLKATKPSLLSVRRLAGGSYIAGKIDDPALPFADIKVRRAISMAIDRHAIAKELFKGEAEIYWMPVAPAPDFSKMFIPLKELPESTRELFEYHPDKAKQLLAEAGYPNGFKTEIIIFAEVTDLVSVAKYYLDKIGVDMEIKVYSQAIHTTLRYQRTFKAMTYATPAIGMPYRLSHAEPKASANCIGIDNPVINDLSSRIYAFENMAEAKRADLVKQRSLEFLSQAYAFQLPVPYVNFMWWPWLKNYHGEQDVGFYNYRLFSAYIWLDQVLKKNMGY